MWGFPLQPHGGAIHSPLLRFPSNIPVIVTCSNRDMTYKRGLSFLDEFLYVIVYSRESSLVTLAMLGDIGALFLETTSLIVALINDLSSQVG